MKEKINCPICRKRAFDICFIHERRCMDRVEMSALQDIVQICCRISSVKKRSMKQKIT